MEQLNLKEAQNAKSEICAVIDNIEKAIKGKRQVVELTVLCLIGEGHVLIEDIPGVGKTSLVSALAKSISCDFKRIQFTPDVMPSDVTGFSIYNPKSGEFEFRAGAAMSNIVLADEINRASAKTQSSMLEIMEEKQVTVDSNTYKMEPPYMVLATQNPIESLGTYQLPEAQIDRFMIKISIGYPQFDEEVDIVLNGEESKNSLSPVVDKNAVRELIRLSRQVTVSPLIGKYIVQIIAATRENPHVKLGSSPRGGIALYKLSKAYALYQGRNYVLPDDVKYLAPFVLSHRLMLTHAAKTEKVKPEDVIKKILEGIIVPVKPEENEA